MVIAHAAHQLPYLVPVLVIIVLLTAMALRDGRERQTKGDAPHHEPPDTNAR
jgi:hypothetical protein